MGRQPWYAGISIGDSKLDNACVGGFSCDDKDTSYRAYAGTHFNRWLGLELGATNLGKWDRGGGQSKAWAADIAAARHQGRWIVLRIERSHQRPAFSIWHGGAE